MKYDYFECDKMGIFTVPKLGDVGGLDYDGGIFKGYDLGDDVPWRTLWYDYGRNFTVVHVKDAHNVVIHTFEDGKYAGRVFNDGKSHADLADLFVEKSVYDDMGRQLSIGNKDAYEEYVWLKGQEIDYLARVKREYNRISSAISEGDDLAKMSLAYLRHLAENGNWFAHKLRDYVGGHSPLWDYGAYLYLGLWDYDSYLYLGLTETDTMMVAKSAQEFFKATGYDISDYFTFAKVPLTDRSALCKVDTMLREEVEHDLMDFDSVLSRIRDFDWLEVIWLAEGATEERMVYDGESLADEFGVKRDVRFREITDYSLSYEDGRPILKLWWEGEMDD